MTARAQAGIAGSGAARARTLDVRKVLAHVVHLSDNDVRFRSSRRTTVFVDPMAGPADPLATARGMVKPDLILITHSHMDHFNVVVLREYARRNPKLVIAGPPDVARYARASDVQLTEVVPGQDYVLAGVMFHTVPAYHLDETQHPRVNGWLGYVLHLDGVAFYVTGDTQPLPEMAELKVDVLFPPLYGCGSNVEQALAMTAACRPRVVVPVHSGGQEDVIEQFLTGLPRGVQGAYYRNGTLVVWQHPAASKPESHWVSLH